MASCSSIYAASVHPPYRLNALFVACCLFPKKKLSILYELDIIISYVDTCEVAYVSNGNRVSHVLPFYSTRPKISRTRLSSRRTGLGRALLFANAYRYILIKSRVFGYLWWPYFLPRTSAWVRRTELCRSNSSYRWACVSAIDFASRSSRPPRNSICTTVSTICGSSLHSSFAVTVLVCVWNMYTNIVDPRTITSDLLTRAWSWSISLQHSFALTLRSWGWSLRRARIQKRFACR